MKQTPLVHEELARRNVLPQRHVVDAGYVDAGLMVQSREGYGVELLGPVSRNNQWQAKAGKGYDLSGFEVDFAAREATCPQGHKSISWREMHDQHGHPSSTFALRETRAASARAALCVLGLKRNPGSCLFGRREEFLQLQRRRTQQETQEFQVTYAKRAGIEGTFSEAGASVRVTPIPL
jgi:transposase